MRKKEKKKDYLTEYYEQFKKIPWEDFQFEVKFEDDRSGYVEISDCIWRLSWLNDAIKKESMFYTIHPIRSRTKINNKYVYGYIIKIFGEWRFKKGNFVTRFMHKEDWENVESCLIILSPFYILGLIGLIPVIMKLIEFIFN